MNHSNNNEFITQHRHKSHPGTCKSWINFDGSGTIAIKDSYNVSSINDDGVGDYTVTWDIDFSSEDYSSVITWLRQDRIFGRNAQLAGSIGILSQLTVQDDTEIAVSAFGDQ